MNQAQLQSTVAFIKKSLPQYSIQEEYRDGKHCIVLIDSSVTTQENKEYYPLFKGAGLKVIFFCLLKSQNIQLSYRTIQANTGVAIGTIKNIFESMCKLGYLKVEARKRLLLNSKSLLNAWAEHYAHTLKLKLFVTALSWINSDCERQWREMSLPSGMQWGGECAAALIDGYMQPEEYTIYTSIPWGRLIQSGAMRPDPNGKIRVYHKFWNDDSQGKCVPAILIYADLVTDFNSRCHEAAEHFMHYVFRNHFAAI